MPTASRSVRILSPLLCGLAPVLWGGLPGQAAVPALPAEPNPTLTEQVQLVAQHLVGAMDTSARALANPKLSNVRMTTCRVTLTTPGAASGSTSGAASGMTDATYLYQEQAIYPDLAKPYRQRFLELSPSVYSQTVRSRSFKLAQPDRWINLCARPDRSIEKADLGLAICSVFLKRDGDEFWGSTPADGCPANVRGATRIKNNIRLHAAGMDTWDRGYDAQGQQVWGAKTESYQFRWVTSGGVGPVIR
jgi:CpeT/CpcT family (DUF1001)